MIDSTDIGSGLLVAGRLADLFGRKRQYIGGLVVFCIVSIVCAVVKVSILPIYIRQLWYNSLSQTLTNRTGSDSAYSEQSVDSDSRSLPLPGSVSLE
jgi:hypothetical protein